MTGPSEAGGSETVVGAPDFRLCVDVDDLERAIAFYTLAFDLRLGRRLGAEAAELVGGPVPIDLLLKEAGSQAVAGAGLVRDFARHWTPVHLDVVVADLDSALVKAEAAGAVLDRPVEEREWGRLANCADPFGNGFCLLQYKGRGYGAIELNDATLDAGATAAPSEPA